MIRLYIDGKASYKSTTVKIRKEFWDVKNSRVKSSHPLHSQYNNDISEERFKIEKQYYEKKAEGNGVTVENMLEGAAKKKLVSEVLDEYLKYIKSDKTIASFKKYSSAVKTIRPFFQGAKLASLNRTRIRGLVTYLKTTYGNSNTTVHHKVKLLGSAINHYYKDREDENYRNPAFGFAIKKDVVNRAKLSLEEVYKLMELDLAEGTIIRASRQIFLFQTFAHGMRIWDALAIRPDNFKGRCLAYVQKKTGKPIELLFDNHPLLIGIVDEYLDKSNKYVFPFLNSRKTDNDLEVYNSVSGSSALINKNLKILAKRAGIDKNLSTHIARHSYASIADELIFDKRAISASMGHSNYRTTETYLANVDTERQRNMNNIFYPERHEKK
jgi:integrase